jgi:hypothetical protein
MLIFHIQLPAAGAIDPEEIEIGFVVGAAAVGGETIFQLAGQRAEAAAEHEIDDALIGPVAIFSATSSAGYRRADASGGMLRISWKPEMRRPLSSITGRPSPRPRPLCVCGASASSTSDMLPRRARVYRER